MPDGFKYDLELDNKKFEGPAKESSATAQKLGKDIKEGMDDAAAATDKAADSTENFAQWRKRLAKEEAEAATATSNSAKAIDTKLKPSLDQASKSANTAGISLGKMAVAGLAMQGLAGAARPLAEAIGGISPAAEKAVAAVGNVVSAAATGFAAGGLWGAALAGGVTLLAEVAGAIDLTGGAAERNAKAAAEAEEMVIRKKQEHLQLLKDLGKQAADTESARQGMERERAQSNKAAAAGQNEFGGAKAQLALEARRIGAGALDGKAGIAANQQIDKDAVDEKYGRRQSGMESNATAAQREVDRVLKDKQNFQQQLANTPEKDDKRRAELAGDLAATEKELLPLQKAARAAADELTEFKTRSAQLAEAEKKNIDAKAGQDVAKEDKKAAEKTAAETKKAEAEATEAKKAQEKKAEDEAKAKQSALTKQRDDLQKEIGGEAGGDGPAGSPRAGRASTRGTHQIKGAVSRNTFGPKQITDRMRETGDLRARARKFADNKDESPATAKQVETLGLILRELKKSNTKSASP